METLDHIHIFRTNVGAMSPDCDLSQTLNNHTGIDEWTIDCEDIDCVLRVVSASLNPMQIAKLVQNHGYHCEEL